MRLKFYKANIPSKDEVGEVSHFRALTASLSGTIGLGNIAGVAVAIQLVVQALFFGCGSQLSLE